MTLCELIDTPILPDSDADSFARLNNAGVTLPGNISTISNVTMKLDFNERSDGSPEWLNRALQENGIGDLWRYPDRSRLENCLAGKLQLSNDQVLVCNGGDEAIDLVMRLCARQQRQVLIPLPAFSMYPVTAERNQLQLNTVTATDNWRVDQRALLEVMDAKAVDKQLQLLILTSPNNPSGEALSATFVEYVCEKARAQNTLVLLDEAYADFADQALGLSLVQHFDNIIVLRSFSKSYGMAGLRVGYLFAQSKTLAAVRALAAPFNVSSPSLYLAEQALSIAAIQERDEYVQRIRKNRERLRNSLISWRVTVEPSEGNFLLLPLTPLRAQMVATYLAGKGIAVRDFRNSELSSCLRITVPLNLGPLLMALEVALSPRLICLDMDGVLIDTRNSYDACIKDTVRVFGGGDLASDELQTQREQGNCNDDWQLTRQLLQKRGIEQPLETLKAFFQSLYEGTEKSPQMAYKTREQILVNAKTANILRQYKTAIVTGRPATEAIEGAQRLPWTPDAVVSRDDVVNMKPAPDGILQSARQFKSIATWMLGDTVDDVRAGIDANALAIGIGDENARALYEAGASVVITDINRLGDLL